MMKPLFLLLALASACCGRIGETLEECAKRYGEVTERVEEPRLLPTQHVFSKDGIRIVVILNDDGRCMLVSYGTAPGKLLSDSQVKSFLALNRGRGTWIPREGRDKRNNDRLGAWSNKKENWHSEHVKVDAYGSRLTISTEKYRDWLRKMDWEIRHN